MIYFVQAVGGQGPIKIGYTGGGPQTRLQALQHGSPVPLIALAARHGTRQDERRMHERFAEHRLYSEWFSPCPSLLELIGKIRSGARSPRTTEWIDYRYPVRPPKRGNWNPTNKYHRRMG